MSIDEVFSMQQQRTYDMKQLMYTITQQAQNTFNQAASADKKTGIAAQLAEMATKFVEAPHLLIRRSPFPQKSTEKKNTAIKWRRKRLMTHLTNPTKTSRAKAELDSHHTTTEFYVGHESLGCNIYAAPVTISVHWFLTVHIEFRRICPHTPE
eukprot:IDg15070t1